MSTPAALPDKPRLRIAVLSRRFEVSGGGAERYASALVERLAARHEIHVFAQRFGAAPALPVTLHRVPFDGLRPRWINQLWFAICSWWQTRRGFDPYYSLSQSPSSEIERSVVAVGIVSGSAKQGMGRPRAARPADVGVVARPAVSPQVFGCSISSEGNLGTGTPNLFGGQVPDVAAGVCGGRQ